VIDKPFTATSAQADALIALAEKQDRIVVPFHNRRWDGDFLTVRRLVEEGALGELLLMEAHWDRFRPALRDGWKEKAEPGSGLLFDLGTHMIDQALLLFGKPDAVAADIATTRPGSAVDDSFELRLDYGAARVRLCASVLLRSPRPRFALHGTKASFVKYGTDPQEDRLKGGGRVSDVGFGEDAPGSYGLLSDGDGRDERVPTARGSYLGFYEALAAAALDGGPVPVDPRDARDGIRIIERAFEAAKAGCRLGLSED
jgi:scyllo-inositol 2-dehydrogenase (NADP+)